MLNSKPESILRHISRSYLAADGVAVFEPEGFEPVQHLPSPIFTKPLEKYADLPAGWNSVPRFIRCFGRNIATLNVGDADLYGGGEAYGELRRNGDRLIMWNADNVAGILKNGKRMYQSHPWLLGVRKDGSAFGIIADTSWKSTMYAGKTVRFVSRGPAFRIVIIEKDNPAEVMKALAALSGTASLPPLWTLGYHQCRYSYFPQERAAQVADELRRRRIPCDVIWMDIHYMDKFKIFTFDKDGYHDPDALNSYLHGKGFKTVYMIDPGVKVDDDYFVDKEGVERDYFLHTPKGGLYSSQVWPGECHFPDFTRPDVRKWWAGLYSGFMVRGIDGVWNDMNEPTNFEGFGSSLPENLRHKGGALEDGAGSLREGPHLRYHNLYGYYMVKASLEGISAAKPDKRPFLLSRSNFLGGQRFASSWTGDNYSDFYAMKVSVPMTINMGLTLQTFTGPDIGGFLNDCTAELLRHWTATGVYFPFVRNHSSLGTVDQEPWAFDAETEDVCRTAIERRYRLLPYFYTLFEEASRTGIPVMRPVFWADFKDVSLRGEQQAFLAGGDLLVIPRWCEAPVLPEGDWEMFSLEDEGGKNCCPDDGYQAFLALRPGAVLPVAGVIQNTEEYDASCLTLLVNPDSEGNACGTLYEDAGDGFGYRKGEFRRSGFKVVTEGGEIILTESRIEGEWPSGPDSGRKLRIGLVRGGRISYSSWSSDGCVRMPATEEPRKNLRGLKLPFIKLVDGSVSKRPTKLGIIMADIVSRRKKE